MATTSFSPISTPRQSATSLLEATVKRNRTSTFSMAWPIFSPRWATSCLSRSPGPTTLCQTPRMDGTLQVGVVEPTNLLPTSPRTLHPLSGGHYGQPAVPFGAIMPNADAGPWRAGTTTPDSTGVQFQGLTLQVLLLQEYRFSSIGSCVPKRVTLLMHRPTVTSALHWHRGEPV